ncbi:MAG: bifunctional DNA primase/polymerase [Metallibacterium scheffleri]|jgi:hypothetical protein|uniref:bifunctional DNA primase/polymerase n=1 Tax=Metallibacterium scheffleri TaxID=993689 RepID=UPI0026ED1991|nr:bifunctional DNA primase/polymerase [Metallibacterium scheffleri]MCK9365898.1 bifunctional DNA primase/polymerase [Metallibacterium scheffleri]
MSAYTRDLAARAEACAPQPLPDPTPPAAQPDAALFAQAYARFGWLVLPIKPGAKRPLTRHGHKDATRDVVKIRALWQRAPAANVGVAVEPSGLIVVDVDPRNGGRLDALPALPPTLTAHTGGGGLHLFFRRPTPCPRLPGKLAAGIDLKTDGYILVAPSVTAGAYRFDCFDPLRDPLPDLAEYPLALLHGSEAAAAAPAKAISPSPRPTHKLPATIEQGERNATLLRLAAGFVRRGIIGDELNKRMQRLNAERCQPLLGADEIDGIATRAESYGSSGYVLIPHRLLDSPGWRSLSHAAQAIALVAIRRAVNDTPFALAVSDFAERLGFRKRGAFYRHRTELLRAEFLRVAQHGRRTQQGCTPDLYTVAAGALQGSLSAQREPSEMCRAQSRKVTKGNLALGNQREPVVKSTNRLLRSCAVAGTAEPRNVHALGTQTMAALCVLVDNRPLHIPSAADYYTPQAAA